MKNNQSSSEQLLDKARLKTELDILLGENKDFKRYDIKDFSLDVLKEAIEKYMEGKPEYKEASKREPYKSPYVQLTREEVLNLKDGDICYIESSWGMQKTTYPELDGDTHRNMIGEGGCNKTTEQKRDFGPIYKLA